MWFHEWQEIQLVHPWNNYINVNIVYDEAYVPLYEKIPTWLAGYEELPSYGIWVLARILGFDKVFHL